MQWRLLTNRAVDTLAEASELIDWYRARWEIEMFFDILKNACKIEELQLKTMYKLEVAIALYTVVAWRINRLMRLGRECPELEASLVFEPDEWMAANHTTRLQSSPLEPVEGAYRQRLSTCGYAQVTHNISMSAASHTLPTGCR